MDVICRTASSVVLVNIFYVFEVFRQVQGYLSGIVYLVHKAHSKKLYPVGYQEPPRVDKVVGGKVSPRWKVELKPNTSRFSRSYL